MIFISIILFAGIVLGHSNLRLPIPRGNVEWSSYCSSGLNCPGPCESSIKDSQFIDPFYKKRVVQRGEQIRVEWLRQNHPGGFVRLAFASFNNSDDTDSFNSNVAKYSCYEAGCGETEFDPVLGELNGRGDGVCSTHVIVPMNIPDGPVTLQWIWFGGGVYFSDKNTTFANYFNCADMQLKGGPTSNQLTKPVFEGGDAANKNKNQCRYWGPNKVGDCPNGYEKGEACGRSGVHHGSPNDPNL